MTLGCEAATTSADELWEACFYVTADLQVDNELLREFLLTGQWWTAVFP